MKMILCSRVYRGFEDLFTVGEKYPVIETSPNGMAWSVQRKPDETPTFISVNNSVFGLFVEVDSDD